MNDMTRAIVPKSDQLNTDDLIAGARTITVTKVAIKDSVEQPVSISFDGDGGKPYKPCKSMSRVLVHAWGKDASKYVGRSMTLYRDPEVTWGGMKVGGIRISHMSDIKEDKTMALTATKQSKKPFTVKPLTATTAAPSKPADAAIKKAGDEAAALGVAEYTAWLGKLSPEAKETARVFSKEWTAIAREADSVKAKIPQSTDDGYPADTGEGDPE